MRDPARIDRILDGIRAYWKTAPDIRLGQLLCNEVDGFDMEPYFVEDDAVEEAFRALADPPAGPEPQPTEAPQERYSALYFQASENMDRHYRRARKDRPCSCVGAGGSREMCEEGRAIYATVVNPMLLAGAPAGTGGRR